HGALRLSSGQQPEQQRKRIVEARRQAGHRLRPQRPERGGTLAGGPGTDRDAPTRSRLCCNDTKEHVMLKTPLKRTYNDFDAAMVASYHTIGLRRRRERCRKADIVKLLI